MGHASRFIFSVQHCPAFPQFIWLYAWLVCWLVGWLVVWLVVWLAVSYLTFLGYFSFDVLLTVHLSVILAIDQLNAQILVL